MRWSQRFLAAGAIAAVLCLAPGSEAQQQPASSPQQRPGLFLREDWNETPAATPITQEHVANADLLLTLYGPGREGIRKSHHDKPADDPFYVWSGQCPSNWAVTLRHKRAWADLTGLAKIRWRSEQSGFRQLHIILKLASGARRR